MAALLSILAAVILAITVSFPPVAQAQRIDQLLRTMTLEEKIGQILFPAFRSHNGNNMTRATEEVTKSIMKYHVGGVILFKENLVSKEQTLQFIEDLQQSSAKVPLFIGVDQEGGRVTRLPFGTTMPGNMALAASGNPENAYLAAKAIGEELNELGFNLNFAPVLDVNSNPDNPVIGVRSFGEDPLAVASYGKAYIRGLHAAGVATAVKHFPGHGDTAVDSHLGLPSLPLNLKQLETRELLPFQLVMDQAPDMIMTAHIALPEIERKTAVSAKNGQPVPLPATLSGAVLTDLLRGRLDYKGVIITDALNMKAISEHFGPADAAVRAVAAGADILLMPELEASYDALLAAIKRGEISEQRIDQSVRRILEVKEKRGLFAAVKQLSPKSTKKERSALEASLADQAVTLLKNDNSLLPFVVYPKQRVLLLAPKADQLEFMRLEAERFFKAADLPRDYIQQLEYRDKVANSHRAAIETADKIIIASDSSNAADRDPDHSPAARTAASLIQIAKSAGKPIAVIAVRNPYDIMFFANAPACLAVYAPIQPNIAAGIRAVFGNIQPQGRLPVTIRGKDGGVLYSRGFGLSY